MNPSTARLERAADVAERAAFRGGRAAMLPVSNWAVRLLVKWEDVWCRGSS
jgi:hypothetical protein